MSLKPFGKYRDMLLKTRRSPHYWAQVAKREFQTAILEPIEQEAQSTYKDKARAVGISTQQYLAMLRGEEISLTTMSKIAAAQGKRIRITLEPIPATAK